MSKRDKVLRLLAQGLGGGTALALLWVDAEFSVMYEYDEPAWRYLRMAAPHLALVIVMALALTLLLSVAGARLLRCRWLPALGRTAKAFASGAALSIGMLAVMILVWMTAIASVETLME